MFENTSATQVPLLGALLKCASLQKTIKDRSVHTEQEKIIPKSKDYGYQLPKIERSLITTVKIAGHKANALVDCGAEIDLISE